MKRKFYVLYSLALALALSGCSLPYPRTYSSEELEGRIVDEDTGEPLEGVNVVAYWELFDGIEGHTSEGVIKAMETVTDMDGRFQFPAWGPELVLRPGALSKGRRFVLFKSGYVVRGATYEGKLSRPIKLWKFKGSAEKYASEELGNLDSYIGFIREDCHWKKIPRMLLATTKELQRLDKICGYERSNIENVEQYLFDKEKYFIRKCGISPREFFNSYEQ